MDYELETVSPYIDKHIAEQNITARLLTLCVLCIIDRRAFINAARSVVTYVVSFLIRNQIEDVSDTFLENNVLLRSRKTTHCTDLDSFIHKQQLSVWTSNV